MSRFFPPLMWPQPTNENRNLQRSKKKQKDTHLDYIDCVCFPFPFGWSPRDDSCFYFLYCHSLTALSPTQYFSFALLYVSRIHTHSLLTSSTYYFLLLLPKKGRDGLDPLQIGLCQLLVCDRGSPSTTTSSTFSTAAATAGTTTRGSTSIGRSIRLESFALCQFHGGVLLRLCFAVPGGTLGCRGALLHFVFGEAAMLLQLLCPLVGEVVRDQLQGSASFFPGCFCYLLCTFVSEENEPICSDKKNRH